MKLSYPPSLVLVPTVVCALVMAGCGTPTAGEGNGPPPPPPPPPPTNPPPGGIQVALVYGTYVGGAGFEEGREPIVLPGGRLLFGARTFSTTMPTTAGALQGSYAGGAADSWLGILNSSGTGFEAATYFGGSGMERPPYGIVVMGNGDIVFTSATESTNLPTSSGAYRTALNSPVTGGYVCRVAQSLTTIQWCTYITGWPRGGLGLAANEDIYVVGFVKPGATFTATAGAYQTNLRGVDDSFVMRLSSDGAGTLFRTRLGGSYTGGNGEAALSVQEHNNRVVVIGITSSFDFPTTPGAPQVQGAGAYDTYVAHLSPNGTSLTYSTLMGGSGGELTEHGMTILSDGAVLVAGETHSANLPAAIGSLSGSADGFVAKLNGGGTAFEFVRYVGGSGADWLSGPVVDSQGRIYLVGWTSSTDFPVTAGALQTTYGGGATDAVFVILSPDARTILYATYLGGNGNELIRGIALDPSGGAYMVGGTSSNNFPVTSGAFQTSRGGDDDAFALKLSIN
ncbi:MAG: SBBP repeat-containing protein [Gemmatimonadetes bacterium]|nr:SBBP repeat-containing protein [Gemmatimonadota bacterium]